MTSTQRPEALISSPADNTRCDECELRSFEERIIHGVRYEGETESFAHCPECGSTELTDDRSPFEVLREAWANYQASTTPEQGINRFDVVVRVAAIADKADRDHCEDCTRNARWAESIIPQFLPAEPTAEGLRAWTFVPVPNLADAF